MFKVGDEVSYGLHGKCVITAIETKELSSGSVSFYQIHSIKNPIIAKQPVRPGGPKILIPVDTAKSNGLRALMSKEEVEEALKLFADADYHFEMKQTWVTRQKLLEDAIRKEGHIGLAKVIGHLFVLISQDAVPPSNVMKYYDNVFRIFTREMADCMEIAPKEAEVIVNKALREKLHADS